MNISVFKEIYTFKVAFKIHSNNCECRMMGEENVHPSTINENFTQIIFETPITLSGYVNDVKSKAKTKEIKTLKVSKENKFKIKDYFS